MNLDPAQPDRDDDEAPEEMRWADIIRPAAVEAQSPSAQAFLRLLATPPPMAQLRSSQAEVVHYVGVPETPTARRNKIDQQLQGAQAKFEMVLHLLAHHMETTNPAALGGAAAFARSGWEDLQQQRRAYLAGRQAYKLDPRPDYQRARLLKPEESRKLERQKTEP